jgi:protein gp37
MSEKSHISWTQSSWNCVTGCSHKSTGCAHCYAERFAARLQAAGNPRYRNGFKVTLHPDLLDLPQRWREPRLIFVNSMADLFHEKVPFEFIKRVFETMNDCPRHTFQILTKRSERLRELAPRLPWPSNVWMGVTVENNTVFHRIDDLRTVPAHVRFLSCEPLLGPLDGIDLTGLHWLIAGGESGSGPRPMDPDWVRFLRDECKRKSVPFYFKQWGGVQKKAAGCLLDGKVYHEMPRLAHGKPLEFEAGGQ